MKQSIRWTAAVLLLFFTATSFGTTGAAAQTLRFGASALEQAVSLQNELQHTFERLTSHRVSAESLLEQKWEYSWNETDWKLEAQTIYVYDQTGRIEEWRYTWNGASMVNETRTKTTPGGTAFTLQLNEQWDVESASFVPVDQYKTDYVFDWSTGETQVSSSLYQTWDGAAWHDSQRTTYTYGDNLTIQGSQTDVWDGTGWIPSSRFLAAEENGDVVFTYEDWGGAAWEPTERMIFSEQTIKNVYKEMETFANGLSDYEGLYFGLHLAPEFVEQEWDASEWVNTGRTVRYYDFGSGEVVALVFEGWEDGDWVETMRFAVDFESPGIPASTRFDVKSEDEWMTFTKESYERDDKGSINRVVVQWDLGEGLANASQLVFVWRHGGTSAERDALPARYALDPAYPNPFNPATNLSYRLSEPGRVAVRVYDSLGRLVATLADGVRAAGTYEVTFDAANLPSGQYVVRLEAAGFSQSRMITLLK